MCDYDRLHYDDQDWLSTATSAPLQDVFALEHTKKDCMNKRLYEKGLYKKKINPKRKNKNREMVSKR